MRGPVLCGPGRSVASLFAASLFAASSVLVAACTAGGVSTLDGGPRVLRDGGLVDASAAPPDVAAPTLDAAVASDSGTAEDTGMAEIDGGPSVIDAGTEPDASTTIDSGPSCIGEPTCGLAPQCGCAPEQMCDVDDLRTGSRHCIGVGTNRELEPCSTGSCAPGLRCLGEGADALCGRYCAIDTDCAAGAECVDLAFADGMGLHSTPGAHVCTVVCDPITQTGCPLGYGCSIGYSIRAGLLVGSAGCVPSGAQPAFAPCDAVTRCAPGTLCVSNGTATHCEIMCDVARPGLCPAPLTCVPPATPLVIRGVSYGLCGS